MTTQAFAIGLILLIFLSINILLIRYILIPLFSRPILLLNEVLLFLETQNCLYISHSASKKRKSKTSKKDFFETLFSISTKYDLIAFSNDKKEYIQFNVWVTKYYSPFFGWKRKWFSKNRNIQFSEETDRNIIGNINKLYQPEINIVKNICPACKNKIEPNATLCFDCGLFFT